MFNAPFKRFNFYIICIIQVLLISTSCNPKKTPPNVVFILADDLGWADLPTYGNKFNEAPQIDLLAKEGMTFTNAYAAGAVCSPTRASIMSGQYTARVGVIDYIPGHWRPFEAVIVPQNRTQYLPQEVFTIGEMMGSAGYATAYFGKWHLGNTEGYRPLEQGFDVANVGTRYYNTTFDPPREVPPAKRLSESLTDFGIEFIEENKDKPFFLFISHFDVHVQLDADNDLIQKYLDKPKVDGYPCNVIYAAMIEHLDRSVGRINDKLKELELEENTIFIFFSDNGGLRMRGDKGPLIANGKRDMYAYDSLLYIATENTPLRREKGTLYEGGIREPMIVKWPKEVKPGVVSDALVCSVDFYPTLAHVAGATLPTDQIFDGKSILSELQGEIPNKERIIYWHYPVYHHDVPASAVRKGDWKLIKNLVDSSYQLYHLKEDIGELKNLAEIQVDKTVELADLLEAWLLDVKAELPVKNPDFEENKRFKMERHPGRGDIR